MEVERGWGKAWNPDTAQSRMSWKGVRDRQTEGHGQAGGAKEAVNCELRPQLRGSQGRLNPYSVTRALGSLERLVCRQFDG